jgi:DNA-binding NtrC family response regulator
MNGDLARQDLGIIGISDAMQEIRATIRQVAPTDITVLVTGESGVGKELVARALHEASKRGKNPMVTVNCGAIPEGIIESELFGHERGSFTSAVDSRKGYFEIADGGTVFLDEIGEMPLNTQVKLLRVLESGEYMRVGSSTPRTSDARVIAATNKELDAEVRAKRFRPDLFFRLRSVNIWIPPLRQRRTDIPLLIEHFAREISAKNDIKFEGFTDQATELFVTYEWPGNIRELRNVIESVIVLGRGKQVNEDDVRKYLTGPTVRIDERNLPVRTTKTVEQAERELIYRALIELKSEITELRDYVTDRKYRPVNGRELIVNEQGGNGNLSLDEMEKEMISKALERNRGNRRMAARELKISERTLYRKIKEYGLNA